ncbi:hexose transporter Hxt15p [Trichomonascus vanleenenianus]|uniref:sugar porter family MFS transporter n=1 Tax=Trichomonascus vanleenenianus TaxID=2268995 RepID=UPI003ECA1C2E
MAFPHERFPDTRHIKLSHTSTSGYACNMINLRLISLTLIAGLGGILFGYDTGFIGGAVTLPSFQKDFGINEDNAAVLSGNVVAALQAGCFFGVIAMAFITDKLGRRLALIACGVVFNIGAVIQTVAKGKLGLFYVGRVISGLAVGSASMLTPLMIGESSPKEIRGKLLTVYGCMLFFGIAISYWVDYACQQLLSGSNQWRVPVALQLIPGSVLSLGVIPLRESPRWLVKKGKKTEGFAALAYLRQGSYTEQEIYEEFAEICAAAEIEAKHTVGVSWKEVFLPGNRYRFFIAISIMICQQMTGTISFTYYAPLFFKAVGLSDESAGLFATGVYGIVKTVSSIVWMLWFIERVGRRGSLLFGGALMGSSLLVCSLIFAQTDVSLGPSTNTYVMIATIYVFCVAFSVSWGPVPWTYASEIFPSRLREYGITAASATQWAFNFMISKVVPIGVENLGWRLFFIFAIFNFVILVYTWFFIKETKGISMEEMERLFGSAAVIDVEEVHNRAGKFAARAAAERSSVDETTPLC